MASTTLLYAYVKSYFVSRRFIVIFPIYLLLGVLNALLIIANVIPKPADIYAYTSNVFNDFVFANSLLAGIMAGDAISRDFSREGFFTLTQPVSRTKIFILRFVASFIVSLVILLVVFYILGLGFGYYLYGTFVPNVALMLVFGMFFLASVISLALLFSSLFRSPLVSGIVVTMILWFVMPAISGVLQFVKIEPWFLLNYAGSVVQNLARQNYPTHFQEISVPAGPNRITVYSYNVTINEAAAIIAGYTIVSFLLGILIYRRKELVEV